MKVLIVGGGPGGYVSAIRAAQLGADVMLIESDQLGGTCLNRGCIPTKCLLHTAGMLSEIRERGYELGIKVKDLSIDFKRTMQYKNSVSQKLRDGINGLMKINNIKVIQGVARFVGVKELEVKTNSERLVMSADAIIIATGSTNSAPPILGVDNPNCIDSNSALCLEQLPKSMAVIGGGVIGLEFAYAYSAFGTKISVIESMSNILPMLESDLSKHAMSSLKNRGIDFYTGCQVEEIKDSKKGVQILFKDQNSNSLKSLEAEKVLISVGRRANTKSLELDVGRISHKKGEILVDKRMCTNVEGVYAIGDCVYGYTKLAHTASAMGEIAAQNIMGKNCAYDGRTTPSCVFIEPEIASVGYTEEECIKQGIAYKVGVFPMNANGKAIVLDNGKGFVKIIAGKEFGEILGMHIIGPHASDLISEGALAIQTEATLDEIIATIHSHPTVSEAVREAALNAEKRSIHFRN